MGEQLHSVLQSSLPNSCIPLVPVVDGYSFPHLTKRMNVAGRHITSYLLDLLQRRGVIKVGTERFQAPEALFTPELIDVEGDGMADMVFHCIQEMDIDNRMMSPFFLTSESAASLEKEILDQYLEVVLKGNKDGLKKLRLRIEDPPRRKHMVYLGGAVLAGIMKDAPEFWMSRQDYLEEGVACLRKLCNTLKLLKDLLDGASVISPPPQDLLASMAEKKNHQTQAFFLLLSLALLLSSALAISEAPFILAHKKVTLSKLKSGAERVFVSIDVYNRGSANVSLGMELDDRRNGELPEVVFYLTLGSKVGEVCTDERTLFEFNKDGMWQCRRCRRWFVVMVDKTAACDDDAQTAYDVSLSDASWSSEVFDVVTGNTSNSWERLDAGAIVSHSFVLESKVKGTYYGAPAVIKFRIPSKASLQEAYSTPLFPLEILAERPPENKFDWRLLAKYGSQASVLSIVALFIYLVLTPSKSSAAKAAKKRR
ncbi:Actin-related protein 2 [Asimina triloba]